MASVTGFTVSSLLCGIAPNLPFLVAFRIVQVEDGDGRWHQNWIDGQARNPLWLAGGLNERGEMVMTSTRDGPRTRVTWTPNPDGTVRHLSERSEDGGATWTTTFDGRYVRIEE